MTERERYIATLTFAQPDRIPFQPGHGRQSTLRAWQQQGLPATVTDYQAYLRQVLGIPPATSEEIVEPGVDFRMIPQFEEKVLERRPGTLVVQDWKGNICEISDEFDVTYLRNAVDFVTRSWIKCPVETRADWEDLRHRYDALDPQRFPADWTNRCRQLQARDYPSGLILSGPFWQLREWLGFENLCVLLLDDPEFMRQMIRCWEQYGTQTAYRGGVDKRAMAKGGATIREEMARLQPAIAAGGFIPSCDHGVPSDVSWPNFVDYSKLLAQATRWL
ncbi:MAG: hypothetical protein WCS70_04465 [Verrucomicrobiota bacterium]